MPLIRFNLYIERIHWICWIWSDTEAIWMLPVSNLDFMELTRKETTKKQIQSIAKAKFIIK